MIALQIVKNISTATVSHTTTKQTSSTLSIYIFIKTRKLKWVSFNLGGVDWKQCSKFGNNGEEHK